LGRPSTLAHFPLSIPLTNSVDEFDNIREWALENTMIINLDKMIEIFFHRPNPKLFVYPAPIEGIEQVSEAKLLVWHVST